MAEGHELLRDETIPVVVANELGIIIRVNGPFSKVFLWRPSELVGKPISTIIPENLRDAHNMGFSRFKMSGNSTLLDQPLDLEVLKGNGDVVVAKHFIVSTQEHGEKVFAASIVPR